MQPINEKLIQEMRDKIVENYNPKKIILFGSYAYGNPTNDSDIDLLIIKDTDERRADRFVKVKRMIYNPNLNIPTSPLIYTPKELEERLEMGDDFVKEIITKGKVIYER